MKKVYVIHHSFRGTPESGMIYAVYANKKAAMKGFKLALEKEYNATIKENEETHYEFMYMSVQKFHTN